MLVGECLTDKLFSHINTVSKAKEPYFFFLPTFIMSTFQPIRRSLSQTFSYDFAPGTTIIGIHMCLLHPGEGEALTSTMRATASGPGKEVTIRMMRATDPMEVGYMFQIGADREGELQHVQALAMKCIVSYLSLFK